MTTSKATASQKIGLPLHDGLPDRRSYLQGGARRRRTGWYRRRWRSGQVARLAEIKNCTACIPLCECRPRIYSDMRRTRNHRPQRWSHWGCGCTEGSRHILAQRIRCITFCVPRTSSEKLIPWYKFVLIPWYQFFLSLKNLYHGMFFFSVSLFECNTF